MMRVLPRCDGLRNSLIILLLIFQFSYAKISAVAIFRRDEVDLHKYSAVLAAIEPFRLQLGDEIKKSLNPVAYAFHKIKGDSRNLRLLYVSTECGNFYSCLIDRFWLETSTGNFWVVRLICRDVIHFFTSSGTNLEDPENGIRNQNKEIDVAYSRYEGKINDIVR